MKKVLSSGQQLFKASCNICGCKFSYEVDDILVSSSTVTCPRCGATLKHVLEKNTSEKKAEKTKLNESTTYPLIEYPEEELAFPCPTHMIHLATNLNNNDD